MSKAKPNPARLNPVVNVAGPPPGQPDPLTQTERELLDRFAQAHDPHTACNKHIDDLTKERNRLNKHVVLLDTKIQEIQDRLATLSESHAKLSILYAHTTKDAQIASVAIIVGSALLSLGGAMADLVWKSTLLAGGGATAIWGLYLQNHLARRTTPS